MRVSTSESERARERAPVSERVKQSERVRMGPTSSPPHLLLSFLTVTASLLPAASSSAWLLRRERGV